MTPRPRWIGPLGFPRAWGAEWLRFFRAVGDRLAPWPVCVGTALALGVVSSAPSKIEAWQQRCDCRCS